MVKTGQLVDRMGPMELPVWFRAGLPVTEADLERALVRRLGVVPGRTVQRQLKCCDRHIPDLVIEWGRTITIVEIKRWTIGRRTIEQLTRYVQHWWDHLAGEAGNWTLFGIVAAPEIRPSVAERLPPWCAFQQLVLVDRSRSAA